MRIASSEAWDAVIGAPLLRRLVFVDFPIRQQRGNSPLGDQRFYVITGASGAGKSTLLAALAGLGYSTVKEAALAILKEQQQINGRLLPGVDRQAFIEEVLARNVENFRAAQHLAAPVFFDRGIPECLAWLQLSGVTLSPHHLAAAARNRYSRTVFVAEPWPEVYVCDADRRAPFDRAVRSYEPTVAAYVEAGYQLCVLPKLSVPERVNFVLSRVQAEAGPGHLRQF